MEIKFFGHHLLNENKLTSEQLIEAVEYQTHNNLTLGQLAVKENFITTKEANKINDRQRSQDERFGDVAISLNLLTEEQINKLIDIQKANKVFFGEVLIIKGFFSKTELEKELETFNKEQNIEHQKIDTYIETLEDKNLIKQSINVLQTLYSRIIHDNIKLVNVSLTSSIINNGIIAKQNMRGDENMDFILQVEDNVAINITSQYLKMPCDMMDDLVADVVSEFVNVVLGNIAVKLSSDSIVVDLTPPKIIQTATLDKEHYTFEFTTTQGKLVLYLKF